MVQNLAKNHQLLLQNNAATRSLAYLTVRQVIAQAIQSGELSAAQALPSERELAAALGVSRVTVRKALAGLIEEGLLKQRQGAGTFVAERIVRSFSKLTGFTEDLRARGLNPRSEFLARQLGEVTPEEAMALNLSPGSKVVRLHRLRYAGDEPLAVEWSIIPASILPDPNLVVDSLYSTLANLGLSPTKALQRLRAVALTAEHAKFLQLPVGSATLFLERRAFLDDGRVVEFTRSFYRGDVYDFVAELQPE